MCSIVLFFEIVNFIKSEQHIKSILNKSRDFRYNLYLAALGHVDSDAALYDLLRLGERFLAREIHLGLLVYDVDYLLTERLRVRV